MMDSNGKIKSLDLNAKFGLKNRMKMRPEMVEEMLKGTLP